MKVTMKDLRADDAVRQVEMMVDRIITDQGQSIQFCRDVNLYGLKEAITYLKGYVPNGDFTELDKLHDSMLKAKLANRSIGQYDYLNG